jgi:predicted HAD superfamily hydrolase
MNVDQQRDRLSAIRKTINNKSVEYISFDIFDTLLVRPTVKPTDLFDLVEWRANKNDKFNNLPFKRMRVKSEQAARAKMRELMPFYEDITLNEIYMEMAEVFDISIEDAYTLRDMEMAVEIKYLQPRKSVKPLYDLAVQLGKKIIVTSDIYLSTSFIKQVLDEKGYDEIYRYFISSDLRKSKGRGGLFPYLIKNLGCAPEKICHIGDNKVADKIAADKAGVRAFYWPKTIDFMEDSRVDNSLWGQNMDNTEPGYRLMHGLMINELFDTIPQDGYDNRSLFNGNPYFLGYYGLGVFIYTLTKWINKKTLENDGDVIALLARDGYLIQKAFDLMHPFVDGNLSTEYVRISRSVCYPFDVTNANQLLFSDQFLHYDRSQSVSQLVESRLFLKMDLPLEDYLRSVDIEPDTPCQDYFQLMSALLSYDVDLMQGLENTRRLAEKYYQNIFKNYKKPVLFDCGYSGRAQRILTGLINKPLHGLYIASFDSILKLGEKHRYDNFISPVFNRHLNIEPFNTAVLELVLSEYNVGSLIGFKKNGSGVDTVCEQGEYNLQDSRVINSIQEGALDFIRKVCVIFGDDIEFLNVSPMTSFRMFESFMLNPSKTDARMLANIKFSNGITGEVSSLIGKTEVTSKWKEGFRAFNHKFKEPNKPVRQQTRSVPSNRVRPKLINGKIYSNSLVVRADLNLMRVLKAVDYIDSVALLSKECPSPELRTECIHLIKKGKTKLFCAAKLLSQSGGIRKSKISIKDKLIVLSMLARGK